VRQRGDVTFNKETVSVMNNKNFVVIGAHDPRSGLWRVNLKNAKPAIQSTCNHAHDTSNQRQLINYLHAACFSPVKSTWIAAITMLPISRINPKLSASIHIDGQQGANGTSGYKNHRT
jgi:hypothetical protein